MKRYPKIVQCDSRGQIVIPKDIRQELNIAEGTGFWMFSITNEGILLKKIPDEEISESHSVVTEIMDKSSKINVRKENVKKSIQSYKKNKGGRLEEL
ncbi:MAG: AbrB/MazE/SpoVT family DNA-binding domain-containing protein [Nanoarchaeota archaeon]|nr:AbrB/MazE/SpoVT family DNA-binding domain-containing protein [Nanoarchaeota archaeon]